MITEHQRSVLEKLQGKKAAVVGIGLRSGVPLIRFLLQAGCQVVACDRKSRDSLADVLRSLQGLPVEYQLGDGYLSNLSRCDLLFRTPGMRPDLPELLAAAAAGARLTSEIELVFELANAPVTGITGSDGKTTTTTLVAQMLGAAGRTVYLGGNIGHSLIEEVLKIKETDEIVLELSSFQLMGMRQSPKAAIMTNLSPNHLDYHRSIDEYISAKTNIFRHQSTTDIAVFNLDNSITRGLAGSAPGKALWFSRREPVSDGAYLAGDRLVVASNGYTETVCRVDDVVLPGLHNIENLLAAMAVASAKGVSLSAIRQVATTFAGVEHRLEFVRELAGVRYYNDSIASSPSRTVAGLSALQSPVVLIAGGYDKKIPFQPLAEAMVGRVHALALIGQTADQIAEATKNVCRQKSVDLPMMKFDSLQSALLWCQKQAKPGDAVVLSPACASFDMFRDFEQRGKVFKELVAALK